MTAIFLHPDAEHDLLVTVRRESTQAFVRIVQLLEQLDSDSDLLDRLTQHNFGRCGVDDIHISKWQEQWRKGNDLWRLKLWELEHSGRRYRVIYAFIPRQQHYHVLGILPRDFNYDADHILTKRVQRAYQALLDGL